ncbi:MAG: hypothetical protein Q9210_007655, partial [Variospora velana]
LGNRSLLQTPPLPLAHRLPLPIHLRHQRWRAPDRRAYAPRRHLHRHHHRPQRILQPAHLRLYIHPQDVQAHDADVRLGGAG